MELPYDPATSPLGIYKIIENSNSNRSLHANVHGSITHKSRMIETIQTFINRWIDKIYTHTTEYYSVIKGIKFLYMLKHGCVFKI